MTAADQPAGDGAHDAEPGSGLVRLSWRSTIVLIVALALGVTFSDALGPAVAALSLVMFFAGTVLMAYAYLVGLRRSRREFVTVPGLFLLQECAPASIRRSLLGSFAVQCVVAIIASSMRLYTLIAFSSLAPTFGLGLVGLWAARYGTFDARDEPSP
ncbi:MAG: hypothetical protein P8N02_13405 [Actinomycetota bacterium]|jgi:hypothetical protein|nr:hypothetical protein [Actinomycetota bacterium]